MANEMALRFRVEASMAEAKAALDQGGAAFRKFGADAKAAMSQAATGYQGMVNDFAGVKPDFSSATASADAFKDALNLQDQMNAMRASLDPAYAATLRFAQAQDLAAQAVARGATTQAQADATLTALSQKLGIAEGAAQTFAVAQTNAMAGASRNAATTANVAAQFNDIGMMLAAGQNPFMLAIQQGTQLSQVLGQAGGGIRGAAAALKSGFMAMISPTTLLTLAVIAGGAALVQWAFNAGGAASAADQAAKATDAYGDALGIVQSQFSAATSLHAEYVQAVLSGNKDLINAIELEAKARQAQFNLDMIGAQAAQKASKASLATQAKDLAGLTAQRNQYFAAQILAQKNFDDAMAGEGTSDPAEAAARLEAQNALLADAVVKLDAQKAAVAITSADYDVINTKLGVLNAQLEANGDLIKIVKDGVVGTTDALDGTTGSAVGLAVQLHNIGAWALEAKTHAEGLASVDMSGTIAAAASSAAALARNLGVSLSIAQQMMQAGYQGTKPVILDPRDPNYDKGAADRANNFGFTPGTTSPFDPSRITDLSSGSGGGASGAAGDGVTGMSSKAAAALAELDIAIATINEKVKAGLMSTAEAGDALSGAREKAGNDIAAIIAQVDRLGPAGQAAATALRVSLTTVTADLKTPINDLAKSLSEGLSDPLKEFMKGTMSAGDAFDAFGDSVINKLMDIAIQQAQTQLFQPLISGLFSSLGGGGIGDAVAGAFGVPAFAKGGNHSGGLRIVGENGPELEATGASRIFTANETARMLNPMAGVQRAMSMAGGRMSGSSDMPTGNMGGGAMAPQVNIKIEGVPAGHTATVDQKSSGMDQTLTIMLEKVDAHIGAGIRTGKGEAGKAISDTYGMQRRPR